MRNARRRTSLGRRRRSLQLLQWRRIPPLRQRPRQQQCLQQRAGFQHCLQKLPLLWQRLFHNEAFDYCIAARFYVREYLQRGGSGSGSGEGGLSRRCSIRFCDAGTPSRLLHPGEQKMQLIPRLVSLVGDDLEEVEQVVHVLFLLS